MIKHIVMWKLKDHAEGKSKRENALRMKELLEGCVGHTPGLLKFEVGFDIAADAGPWDVVLYSEFENKAALDAYQNHPSHQAIKPEMGKFRESRAAVDYEV